MPVFSVCAADLQDGSEDGDGSGDDEEEEEDDDDVGGDGDGEGGIGVRIRRPAPSAASPWRPASGDIAAHLPIPAATTASKPPQSKAPKPQQSLASKPQQSTASKPQQASSAPKAPAGKRGREEGKPAKKEEVGKKAEGQGRQGKQDSLGGKASAAEAPQVMRLLCCFVEDLPVASLCLLAINHADVVPASLFVSLYMFVAHDTACCCLDRRVL